LKKEDNKKNIDLLSKNIEVKSHDKNEKEESNIKQINEVVETIDIENNCDINNKTSKLELSLKTNIENDQSLSNNYNNNTVILDDPL
jgi:hypothetical protein